MTAPARTDGTRVVRLGAGDAIDLDVEWCDLVPANAPGDPPALRFKGREVRDGTPRELVRVFLDIEMAETPMRKTGVLRAPIPDLPRGERTLPVPLERRRLTIRRVAGMRGATWYEIRPREGAVALEDEELLGDYHWALAQARNQFASLLQADGLPVGASELLTITHELFNARRSDRQRRG